MNPQKARKRVIQTSFVVRDVRETAKAFVELCGIGPWFLFEHVPIPELKYRGRPSEIDITVAAAFSGSMLYELIQLNDDAPSALSELVKARGYGFHHLSIASDHYDEDLAHYRNAGFDVVNEAARGGSRTAYIDTTSKLPGMLKLGEVGPELNTMLREMEAAASQWDGTDPIRVKRF